MKSKGNRQEKNFTDKSKFGKEFFQDVGIWLFVAEAMKIGIIDRVKGVNHG